MHKDTRKVSITIGTMELNETQNWQRQNVRFTLNRKFLFLLCFPQGSTTNLELKIPPALKWLNPPRLVKRSIDWKEKIRRNIIIIDQATEVTKLTAEYLMWSWKTKNDDERRRRKEKSKFQRGKIGFYAYAIFAYAKRVHGQRGISIHRVRP